MKRLAVLVFLAAGTAAAAPGPLEAELAPIFAARYVGVSASDGVVTVRVQDGPMSAPSWSELRERARKALAVVTAKSAGAIVVVDYAEGGAMAIAETLPGGTVDVRVGAGAILQSDRAAFPLALTGGISVVSESYQNIPGRVTGATCAGKVKNLSTVERTVAVRCIVKRYTTVHEGETLEVKGPFSKSEVIVDETVQVGKLAAGAEAAFAKALSAKRWPMYMGVGGEIAVLSDGAPAAYLDTAAYDLATDWLAVLDKLRADHLGVPTRSPYGSLARLSTGLPEMTFDLIGDQVEKHDPELLAGRVARAWAALKAHYGKFKRAWPQAVKLRGDPGHKATIVDGKLGPFRDDYL